MSPDQFEKPEAVAGQRARARVSVAQRLKAVRWVLATAGVLAIIALSVLRVPFFPVLAGLGLLGLAALTVEPSTASPVAESRPSRVAANARVWPDTGMKLVLEALPNAGIVTDSKGIVRFANHLAVEAFGNIRPGDPLSFRMRVPELLAGLERVSRGGETEVIRFSERVPTERSFEVTLAPIRVALTDIRVNPDFVLVVIDDRSEIERIDRMRGDFIANASHELRTPLQSLSGFIETLLGPAKNDAVNREKFLRIMQDQAGRMARLIDDLLSLSRIEMRAHMRPTTPVDLGEIANHVADALSPLAHEFGISLELECEAKAALVPGDRDELIQVLSNLIENGIKYGSEGGHVRVLLHDEPGSDGVSGLLLSVADDGPGIPAAHLPRLTERFYRVDVERSRARKGTGLGLAIVKHIVQRHRGKLTIHSRPGEGAVFSIWFERSRKLSQSAIEAQKV